MIGVIAAVLAIVATLILASAVSDLRASPSGSSGSSRSASAVQHLTGAPAWNLKPFAPLFRSPVVAPWTEHPPFLAR
jgi:hypothetical protein